MEPEDTRTMCGMTIVDPDLMDLVCGDRWWRMAAWADAARSAIAEERWRGQPRQQEPILLISGRRGGKMAASMEWLKADIRRVMLCSSDDRRDEMRRMYPDIDPSQFIGPAPKETS